MSLYPHWIPGIYFNQIELLVVFEEKQTSTYIWESIWSYRIPFTDQVSNKLKRKINSRSLLKQTKIKSVNQFGFAFTWVFVRTSRRRRCLYFVCSPEFLATRRVPKVYGRVVYFTFKCLQTFVSVFAFQRYFVELNCSMYLITH